MIMMINKCSNMFEDRAPTTYDGPTANLLRNTIVGDICYLLIHNIKT